MKYRFSIGHSLTLGRFRIKLLVGRWPILSTSSLLPPPFPSYQWSRDTNRSSMGIETFTNHLEGGRGNVGNLLSSHLRVYGCGQEKWWNPIRFLSLCHRSPYSLSLSRFLFSPFSFGPLYPLWKSVNETEHTVLVERACRSFYRIASTLIGKLSSCPGSVLFYSSLSLFLSPLFSSPFALFFFPRWKSGIYIQRYTIRPNNLCDFSRRLLTVLRRSGESTFFIIEYTIHLQTN